MTKHHTGHSGDLVVSKKEIQRVILNYCVNNLTNSTPDPEVESDVFMKEYLHEIRMMMSL